MPHQESSVVDLRKRIDDLEHQLRVEKRSLETREAEIKTGSEDALARELHAILCLSVTCAGWDDENVKTAWRSFALSLSLPGGARIERRQVLDIAGQFASNPFYESIRRTQQQMTVELELEQPASPGPVETMSQLEPGPAPVTPGPAAVEQSSPLLTNLTDDDIPF